MKQILLLFLIIATISLKTLNAFALRPLESTIAENFPNILKLDAYTLNTRNVKTIKAQGNFLWIGTSLGLIRYDIQTKEDYKVFDNKNGLLSNGVFSIQLDSNGTPWVGTYGGGLSRFNDKKWVNINTPQGLADAFVFDILFKSKTIWVATWSGINRIEGDPFVTSSWNTYTVENTNKGLIDN